ncbi:hypothetical protein D9M73_134090 [compost metagenome]
MSLAPELDSDADDTADTASGTSDSSELRRVAVTMISRVGSSVASAAAGAFAAPGGDDGTPAAGAVCADAGMAIPSASADMAHADNKAFVISLSPKGRNANRFRTLSSNLIENGAASSAETPQMAAQL